MIILTGGGGFIGSVVLGYLNKQGIKDVVIFDDMANGYQCINLANKEFISLHQHSKDERLTLAPSDITCVIHLGARADTLEMNWELLYKDNVAATRRWSKFCKANNIPFIFASSAAVTGNGNGPVNPYAFSKAVCEKEIEEGVILRFFNVYGPNEYHKFRMASVIHKWHKDIIRADNGPILQLFKGSENYKRDFIYVEDVARVVHHFILNYKPGTYDVGTGTAVSFKDLASEVIKNMGRGEIVDIDMPLDLGSQYQTFTQADTANLEQSGFDTKSLIPYTEGVRAYITYLDKKLYY